MFRLIIVRLFALSYWSRLFGYNLMFGRGAIPMLIAFLLIILSYVFPDHSYLISIGLGLFALNGFFIFIYFKRNPISYNEGSLFQKYLLLRSPYFTEQGISRDVRKEVYKWHTEKSKKKFYNIIPFVLMVSLFVSYFVLFFYI